MIFCAGKQEAPRARVAVAGGGQSYYYYCMYSSYSSLLDFELDMLCLCIV